MITAWLAAKLGEKAAGYLIKYGIPLLIILCLICAGWFGASWIARKNATIAEQKQTIEQQERDLGIERANVDLLMTKIEAQNEATRKYAEDLETHRTKVLQAIALGFAQIEQAEAEREADRKSYEAELATLTKDLDACQTCTEVMKWMVRDGS